MVRPKFVTVEEMYREEARMIAERFMAELVEFLDAHGLGEMDPGRPWPSPS
ncbi:hypothetical protein ACN28S_29885 [Cystobacter fuscus]